MPLSAYRFTLDRLDAYLEALWEGRESPLPEGSPHIAADGEGELVDWVYTRLRSISREPKDVFTREVGGLLEEFRSRICPWNAAAIRLFQDVVPFVATGPRRHEDWAYDVLAVLHHSVRDPRGWVRLDYAPAGTGGDTVPCYPFDPPPAPEFGDRLHPLVAEAAIAAVAIMAEEWGYEPAPVRFRTDVSATLFLTDPGDYDERLRSWLDQMDAAEFGMWARDFFELHRNAAHYDAFRDQMQATFDRVCGGAE